MRTDRDVLRLVFAFHLAAALAKIACGRIGHLLSVEADGYHALTDGIGTLVALVGLRLARRPASAKHPYGHKRVELLVACAIALSLLAVAARLGLDAISHARAGEVHAPSPGLAPLIVMSLGAAAGFAIARFEA